MSSIDVTTDLIEAVLANMDPVADDWVALSAILDPMDRELFPVARTCGYVYAADGTPRATGISSIGLGPAMRTYMESYYPTGEPWPLRLLLQFNRISGEYEITFEESDGSRWVGVEVDDSIYHADIRPKF